MKFLPSYEVLYMKMYYSSTNPLDRDVLCLLQPMECKYEGIFTL